MPLVSSPSLAAMSLLSLFSSSPKAADWPASLAEVRAEIVLEQLTQRNNDTRDHEFSSLKVVLYHAKGGRAIERRDVGVEVNGVALRFGVGVGNYYDRYPSYRLADDAPLRLTPATTYRFVLIAPDAQRHPLAEVTTPAPLGLDQFDWPAKPPAGAIVLGWRDLAEPVQAIVYRSNRWRETENNVVTEAGGPHDPAAPRRQLGGGLFRRKSGTWTIPDAYLQPEGARIMSALGVELSASHAGKVDRAFARDSSIRADRRLTMRMEVPE